MAGKRTEPAAEVDPTTALKAKLEELGVEEDVIVKIIDEFGAQTIEDLSRLNEADLVMAGMKAIPARNLLAALAPTPVEAAGFGAAATFDILPDVMDDSSWLEALQIGGVLKVEKPTVISTLRAALANKVGLYDLPKRLATAMKDFAEANDEPVTEQYYAIVKQLTRHAYGDLFAAIDGLDGSFVNEAEKKRLLDRLDAQLWPAVFAFYRQLKGWQEAWIGNISPATVLLPVLAGGMSGAALPPGMLAPPDTGVLRDQAEELNNAINKVFGGTGVPVASALAYDAAQIKKTLETPGLPAMIGAANRDQMLRQLDVGVSATYPRLENNVTRFVLGALELKDQPAGTEELQYLSALVLLGSQIPWDQIGDRSSGMSGIGGTTRL